MEPPKTATGQSKVTTHKKPEQEYYKLKSLAKLWNRLINFLFTNHPSIINFCIIKDHTPNVDIKSRPTNNCKDICTNYDDGYYYDLDDSFSFSSSSSSGSGYDADYDSDLPTKDVRIKKKLLMSKKERRFNIIRNGVVGNIINIKDYLASQLTSNSQADVDARQQGVILNDKFYFQKALGHGNCFYLAYLTGWLHYIVAHNTIDETIKMLENQKAYRKDVQRRNAIDYTDFLIGMLQKLKENPSLEMIGSILSNSDIANKIAMYLRDFAVFGVANSVEQILVHQDRSKEYIRLPLGKTPDPADTTWRYIWDHTTLIGFTENEKEDSPPTGGILDDNEALCEAMLKEGEELSRETYCKVQRKNGIHVQRPEIGILNDYFVPITLYQRMDIPQNEGRGSRPDGRLDGYGSDNVINLFRSPEHFDALIPKDVIAKTKASLSKKI